MPSVMVTLTLLGALLLTGCTDNGWVLGLLSTDKVSVRELVGTYRAEKIEGYSLLTLRSDMTYIQSLHYKDDGSVRFAIGKWSYDRRRGVSLEHGYAVMNNMLGWRLEVAGYGVEKRFGTIHLTCDPDTDTEFKKIRG